MMGTRVPDASGSPPPACAAIAEKVRSPDPIVSSTARVSVVPGNSPSTVSSPAASSGDSGLVTDCAQTPPGSLPGPGLDDFREAASQQQRVTASAALSPVIAGDVTEMERPYRHLRCAAEERSAVGR